ncbi:MAG: SRPBCC family protein [Terriglobales bacterium]
MKSTGALQVSTPTDREIVMTRVFNAPRRLVYDAHTKPELVRQWLLGPDGWTMPVCEIDLRVGGRYRYVWRKEATGTEMGMGGVFREIEAPERIVNTEKFDDAWYAGEALDTLVLVEQGGKTTLTQTMLLESREARDAVLKTGMEKGVDVSYDRLDEVLASMETGGAGQRTKAS